MPILSSFCIDIRLKRHDTSARLDFDLTKNLFLRVRLDFETPSNLILKIRNKKRHFLPISTEFSQLSTFDATYFAFISKTNKKHRHF